MECTLIQGQGQGQDQGQGQGQDQGQGQSQGQGQGQGQLTRGGQTLGKSHCCGCSIDLYSEVGNPPVE